MQPLTPGKDWSLLISPGVASADGRHRSPSQFKTPVGDVQPFLFESAAMHQVINQAPWLEATFSKPIPLNLTNAFTNWIQIVPRPENLSASVWGRKLHLWGDWQRHTTYALSIARGFPADEAFLLSSNISFSLDVPPVDPRLYFPAFTTDQLATGHRAFPLLAVNVPRVRVRAKLLSDATAIHALRGYSSYQERRWFADNPDPDGYRRLDYKLVPGRTLFDEELPGSQTADQAEEIKLSWDQLLQGRKTGILFIEAERATPDAPTPTLGTQALVQLTDLGLVWKTGGGQVHVFVFSYASGQPVSNVRLQLCSHENQVFHEATTDASGLATLQTQTNASWLLARHHEDLHAVEMDENTVSTWWFDALRNQPWQDPADLRRVALFTDRTAYRPGETVQLKAIARDFLDAGLAIPSGLTGVVTCANSRGKSFFETNVLLSALGSCETSFAVPEDARGAYLASLRLGGREYFKPFEVADFQTPAFDLQLECKPSFAAIETPAIQVGARYFFGQPLHAAQIRWWLNAHDAGFQPEPFSQYQFTRCDDETRWGRKSGGFSADGANQLSSATNRVIPADIPLNPEAPQPRAVSVLVEVTDLNQQTISRAAEFTRHSSAFYLGLKRFERVLVPSQPLPLQVAAVAADGSPWPEPV
ncbi:MAG TPA: MG2 domain-containing protein, partial [Clostridia bacterium]|nr:MG2 domain-containing protein [Clostridia bacterium]